MLRPTSKKSVLRVLAILALLPQLVSCDFFRAVAGRPTTKDLEEMRSCCQDSVASIVPADTVVVADSVAIDSVSAQTPAVDTSEIACAVAESAACDSAAIAISVPETVEIDSVEVDDRLAESVSAIVDTVLSVISSMAANLDTARSAVVSLVSDMEKIDDDVLVPDFKCYTLSTRVARQVEYRYYILIGTFSREANATKQCSLAKAKGYQVEVLPYVNGLYAVGVCPSNSLSEVKQSLRTICKEQFCPSDVCVIRINK